MNEINNMNGSLELVNEKIKIEKYENAEYFRTITK